MSDPVTVNQGDDVRTEPQDALRMLLEGEGFRIFIDHVRSEWGAAALNRKVRDVLTSHPPADHSAMIQALHGTADSVRGLFQWPEEEYERLRSAGAKGKEPTDRFAEHRRTP